MHPTSACHQVHSNLTPEALQQKAIENNEGVLDYQNVLTVTTGNRTGRSPKDRFIIQDNLTQDTVHWGKINQPFNAEQFNNIWQKALGSLDQKEHYHGQYFVGHHQDLSLSVDVYTEMAWHQLFAYNMFNPTKQWPVNDQPTWTLLNCPSLALNPQEDGSNSDGGVFIDFTHKRVLVAGIRYAGEMKKAMFSVLNYLLPEQDVFPMHCSATKDQNDVVSLYFGLSGTGKTTLSSAPNSLLIGDDEHGWSPEGVFNFEGGCYAKCINLSQEKEPVIMQAIKRGAVMENVVLDDKLKPDFKDTSLTQNTRVAYPLNHVDNRVLAAQSHHPEHIIFLCCDLYGVLPPVAQLNEEQAAYYFLSGYTALVGSTEVGQSGIKPTFSTCFGAPFFPKSPLTYAQLLLKRMKETGAKVYLVNTGWHAGAYGTGERYDINVTRSIVDAINSGAVDAAEKQKLPYFNIQIPTSISGINSDLLDPRTSWASLEAYQENVQELIAQFQKNFEQFSQAEAYRKAGPQSR